MKEGYPRGGRKKKITYRHSSGKTMLKKNNTMKTTKNCTVELLYMGHRKKPKKRDKRLKSHPELERIGLMCHENW